MTIKQTKEKICEAIGDLLEQFPYYNMTQRSIGEHELYDYSISKDNQQRIVLIFLSEKDTDFNLYTIDNELFDEKRAVENKELWLDKYPVGVHLQRLLVNTQLFPTSGNLSILEVNAHGVPQDYTPEILTLNDLVEMAKQVVGEDKLKQLYIKNSG